MLEAAGWIAPAATMIAAIMTAANLGARVTGWGFAVFAIGAVAWVAIGAGSGQSNLLWSNAFLLLVDLIGVWRWLGRRARYDEAAQKAAAQSRDLPLPSLFALAGLEGMPVRDGNGETVATIVDAMASCNEGRIVYLVAREGGVGGVGERLHALGWNEVRVQDGAMITRLSPASLAQRPALEHGAWPATAAAAGLG